MTETIPSTPIHEPVSPIHSEAFVGTVSLKTADLDQMTRFYMDVIGLERIRDEPGGVVLGAGSRPIVRLIHVPNAVQPSVSATGLYHTAILFPSRRDLAIKIAQLMALRLHLGEADHLVSEAFYLSDPEGNGIELYRDRPREEWKMTNGNVAMASDPIDWSSFLGEIQRNDPDLSSPLAPEGTKLGHVHLKVADIDESLNFYHRTLGLDVMAHLPGALFVSAGGYHHHIGMNIWHSRGGSPPDEPSTGLSEISLVLPNQAELDRFISRLEGAGTRVHRDGQAVSIQDPSGIRIRVTLPDQM
jgi:catechol 2,3-dioxygenase